MKGAITLRGVSGSGKTTWAQKLKKCLVQTHSVTIVSMDDFFMQGGEYQFNPTLLPQAAATCFRKFLQAVEHCGDNEIVVVDNTNTTAAEIAPYALGAAAYGIPHCIIKLPVPYDLDRNVHGVPRRVVQAQAERLYQALPLYWANNSVLEKLVNTHMHNIVLCIPTGELQ